MSRYYVNVETPQGDFKWYLPTTEFSSVSFTPAINKPNYTEFCQAVLEDWHVDLTTGAFLKTYSPTKEIVTTMSSYFESIPFNLIPASGEIWKIGDMTGVWTISSPEPDRTLYECVFRFSDNSVAFYLEYVYFDNEIGDQRFLCPLIYSTSENKIICQNTNYNLLLVTDSTPYYRGLLDSRTFSVNDTLSTKANEDIIVNTDEQSDDPYDPGGSGTGYSGGGGGPAPIGGTGTTGNGGLHDDSSDAIPIPGLPTNISTGSGLFTAYNPSASQLASFGSALWSMDITDIDDVLRFLVGGDAFNAIIGLHLLPVQPATGSSSNIKLGKWDSGVSEPKLT